MPARKPPVFVTRFNSLCFSSSVGMFTPLRSGMIPRNCLLPTPLLHGVPLIASEREILMRQDDCTESTLPIDSEAHCMISARSAHVEFVHYHLDGGCTHDVIVQGDGTERRLFDHASATRIIA